MLSPWKIHVKLDRGDSFVLNDIRSSDPGWGKGNFDGIRQITFPFFQKIGREDIGSLLILENMEAFNFFMEATANPGGQRRIVGAWFMGKLPRMDSVKGFVITPSGVKEIDSKFGREFDGTPTSGWKIGTGIKHGTPIFKIETGVMI